MLALVWLALGKRSGHGLDGGKLISSIQTRLADCGYMGRDDLHGRVVRCSLVFSPSLHSSHFQRLH